MGRRNRERLIAIHRGLESSFKDRVQLDALERISRTYGGVNVAEVLAEIPKKYKENV